MERIILADTQAIFREGAARVLDAEHDMFVVAQSESEAGLPRLLEQFPEAIVIFPNTLSAEMPSLLTLIERAGSRSVVVVEFGTKVDEQLTHRFDGVVSRSVAGRELVDCVRKVAAGERYMQTADPKSVPPTDRLGQRVLQKLTPRELQVVALVTEGGKNKDIAELLGTKEQVIKNYLRNIYDKAGVSDRLELAVFTQHHRTLADAALRVRQEMQAVA